MINVQKVQEAHKIIEEAEKELRMEVKRYLEKKRVFKKKIKDKDELEMRQHCESLEEVYFSLESGLEVEVFFTWHDYTDWDYTITCKELHIINLSPVTKNDLSAQGELMFQYSGPEDLSFEKKINLKKYYD